MTDAGVGEGVPGPAEVLGAATDAVAPLDEVKGLAVRLRLCAATHPGKVRDGNEDSVGYGSWLMIGREAGPVEAKVSLSSPVTVVVADGLGGHHGGEVASRLAVETVLGLDGDLLAALETAAETIRLRAEDEPELAGMATTIVGLTVGSDGAATFFNVGDSRAYRVVEGYLGQVSRDDRPPVATEANRGVVTQFLGGERSRSLDPHLQEVILVHGDRLLLCTDGLHDVVSSADIVKALLLPRRKATRALLTAALDAGGPDNISLIVIDVEAVPR